MTTMSGSGKNPGPKRGQSGILTAKFKNLAVGEDGAEREERGAVLKSSTASRDDALLKKGPSLSFSKKKADKAKAAVSLSYEPKSHALTEALLERADAKTRSRVEYAAQLKQSDKGHSLDLVLIEKVDLQIRPARAPATSLRAPSRNRERFAWRWNTRSLSPDIKALFVDMTALSPYRKGLSLSRQEREMR